MQHLCESVKREIFNVAMLSAAHMVLDMQTKNIYWEKGERFVKLKLSISALRTIKKKGLDAVARQYKLDLKSLSYRDVSERRLQWKAAQPKHRAPMAKNPRCAESFSGSL
jgi:large subunit ribosomal protein L28